VPTEWKCATIVPIFKSGDKKISSNYRPISLTSVISKTVEHVIVAHIWNHLDYHQLLSNNQHGFRKYLNCTTQLLHTFDRLAKHSSLSDDVYLISFDFQKAFDSVPHRRLITKLKSYNLDFRIVRWIENWLNQRTFRVRVGEYFSDEGRAPSGVPQGSVLGPLLFLLYIDDIADDIKYCDVRLYADDTLLIGTVKQNEHWKIQYDIDILNNWATTWCMKFNIDKTFLIKTGNVETIMSEFTLGDQQIRQVPYVKYLGVIIHSNLNWDVHVDNIMNRANKSLFMIIRALFYANPKTKLLAYNTCVRSILEYASPVWNSMKQSLVKKLEAVHRRAIRFIYRIPKRDSIADICTANGIPSLADRRASIDKSTLNKIEAGLFHLPLRDYIAINESYNTRGKTISTYSTKKQYRNSFFPRMRPHIQTLDLCTTTLSD
jgi:hypothetical protein